MTKPCLAMITLRDASSSLAANGRCMGYCEASKLNLRLPTGAYEARAIGISRRNHIRHFFAALATLLAMACVFTATARANAQDVVESAIKQVRANPPTLVAGQSATLLTDGRWLLLGGEQTGRKASRSGVLLDASQETASAVSVQMTIARAGHTATVLPSGDVLVLGGVGEDGHVVSVAETLVLRSLTFNVTQDPVVLPRAYHTTTILTDGRMLIIGGVGSNGTVLDAAEVFDPLNASVERFNARLETARFGHIAALLPSAPVLVSGGLGQNNQPVATNELFDPALRGFAALNERDMNRLPQPADAAAMPVVVAMIPQHEQTTVPVEQTISIRFSKPLDVKTVNDQTLTLIGPTGLVPITVVPAEEGVLAFATPKEQLLPDSSYTFFLRGLYDQSGRGLSFTAFKFATAALGAPSVVLSPSMLTIPDSTISGLSGTSAQPSGQTAALTAGTTDSTTARQRERLKTPQDPGVTLVEPRTDGDDDEVWTPNVTHYQTGAWTTDRLLPEVARSNVTGRLKSKALSSTTSLTGLVLKLNDKPLPGATLRIGERVVRSAADGTFFFDSVPAGPQTLSIDATTAGADYGYFETLVDINVGEANVLPYSIWIPKLDKKNAVRIPSPTLSEVVLTSPKMPGFAVVIPPGVVIRDRAGKIVTELSITPIPIDRTPFPLPIIFEFNTYYTIQPAGATLHSLDGKPVKARVIYPNYANVEAGKRMLFWNHDPYARGWHVYGEGEVSLNQSSIVPDSNVGIYQFSGFMVSAPGTPPPSPCPCGAPGSDFGPSGAEGSPVGGMPFAGDPVNLATGAFIYAHTDLALNDIVPLKLRRTYFSADQGGTREFGLGMSSGLDYLLYNSAPTGPTGVVGHLALTLPDGAAIDLACIASCSQTLGAVFEGQTPGYFYKAIMRYGTGAYPLEWILTTKDGTKFVFYSNGGKLKYIADRYGNTTTFTRNPFLIGQLTSVISPNGKSIELSYSGPGGVVTAARDNSGRTWTYGYTGGRMTSATDPMGGIWNYTWDNYGSLTASMLTVKDPRGNTVVTNEYEFTRVKKQTFADGSTTSFVWTLNSGAGATIAKVDVTDRRGNMRRAVFNPVYYFASDTFALGKPESQTTTFTRDPATKLLLSQTDALNRTTAYAYDSNGNMLSQTRLAGTGNAVTTSYSYEPAFNQLASITDPLGHVLSFNYDAQGNLMQVVDANGNAKSMTYTPQGQVATITDALSHTTTVGYDAGIAVLVTDPLGRTTSLTPDAVGRIVSSRDSLGNLTQVDYDALDRVIRVVDPLGNAVLYGFDANGNLQSHTDPRGKATVYTYDSSNRLMSKKDALLNIESYSYDIASALKQIIDRKSQVSGVTYDALNRRTQSGFGATTGNPTAFTSTIGYTYDAGDRLTQANDSQSGVITRGYDGLDRLTSETNALGTVSYTFDAAGRRVTRTVPGQPMMSYGWDNANRLMSLSQGSQTVAFTYDNANRRTKVTLPNGVDINYTYDNASQVTTIAYTKGAATLGDLTYSYDAAGRRTSIGGSYARTDLPSAIAATTHSVNNQLTNWGGSPLTYDLNGNLTSDGTNSYIWNARNQLSEVKQGATTIASYEYDAFGRRKQKVVNGIATRYVHDGLNFVQERDASNAVTADLVTGIGLDEMYARTKASTTSSFLLDHLGTIIAEADATGTVRTSYSYEPYGKTIQTGTASDNSQRFTGREQDLADLYYYRARYYSPRFDRFVSEDPIGIAGGANLYLYADASPTMFVDPTGEMWLPPNLPLPGVNPWTLCSLTATEYDRCVYFCRKSNELRCTNRPANACGKLPCNKAILRMFTVSCDL